MDMTTCLLLDDLARNCVDEHHLERQFVACLRTMSPADQAELPGYLYEALSALHPVEQLSYGRVCAYVAERVRIARIDETELQALLRKLREVLR